VSELVSERTSGRVSGSVTPQQVESPVGGGWVVGGLAPVPLYRKGAEGAGNLGRWRVIHFGQRAAESAADFDSESGAVAVAAKSDQRPANF